MLSRPASPAEHGFTAVDEQADPHAWVGVLDKLRQEPFYVAYKARTVQLLAPVKGGRYLDIGGGTGADARALATHAGPGTNAVVLDRSATMAVQAARRGSLAVVGAAEALPFETATFHGCRADRTFQHLAEPERALMELLRVTQPGGRIVVVDPDYDTQVVDVDDQQLARRVLRFRADQLLRNGTLAHRMAGLFAAAGLVDVKVEAMTLVVRDPNAVDNVMGLRTWAATAHQRGLLAADDAAAWPRAIDRAVAAGRFLYAVTFFLTAGTTPLVRAQPIGCRDPAAAPRHPRWTHSSVQAIVTSHAGSPTPEHPKSITAPKRPSLTSRFAALTSRGNQTDGPSHVAPMLFPRPQSPSRQRSDRPTQRWRSGFRRHGLQRPTAEAVVPPRRRSVGRIDLQPPVFLLYLRRVYASALGSRTNMSTPRRKLLLSHPSSSTGVIVRSAHRGNGEATNRRTSAASMSTLQASSSPDTEIICFRSANDGPPGMPNRWTYEVVDLAGPPGSRRVHPPSSMNGSGSGRRNLGLQPANGQAEQRR